MGIGSWMSLWFALALPVIIILYLFKRIYIDTPVPSHMLWRRVLLNMEANRPWQKLQNRLLLWLQLLAAALLVLALMQPFIWKTGGHQGHTVLIADTSASMMALPQAAEETEEDSKLAEMKRKLNTYIREAGADEEITLIRLGSRPEVLLTRENNRETLSRTIDGLSAEYGKAAYHETLSLAAALTRGEEGRVFLYTDTRWPEQAGNDGIVFEVPVQIVSIGPEQTANAAIEQFGVKRSAGEEPESTGNEDSDGTHYGVAVIRNDGPASELQLDLYGDGKLIASRDFTADPGRRTTVEFNSIPSAEVYRLSLKPEDGYLLDNESFAFLEQAGATKVWLISKGNLFLEKALQLTGAQVTRITEAKADGTGTAEPPPIPESKPDVIVIEGTLPDYAASGAWAKLLAETPQWMIGGADEGVNLEHAETVTAKHPVTRYLQLKEPPAGRLIDAPIPAWGKSILTVGGKTAAYAGTENGRPKLVFLFRLEDGDLTLKPEFPVLVDNAVTWLKSGLRTGLGRAEAGTELDIPVAQDAATAVWSPMDGYALNSGAEPIPAVRMKSGALSAKQPAPSIPGLWRLDVTGSDGEAQPGYWLAVAADPLESAAAPRQDLLNALVADSGQPASGNDGGQGDSDYDEHSARSAEAGDIHRAEAPLLKWIVLIVLLLILVEWGVYQRGRSI